MILAFAYRSIKDGELDKSATCAENAQVQNEGGHAVKRE